MRALQRSVAIISCLAFKLCNVRWCCYLKPKPKKMSSFVQQVCPVTGESEWKLQSDDYDYHQEVARAAYADMLHDHERNKKYEEALIHAVKLVHERDQLAHVLDIGTGTGLLSMMAVRAGADTVTACEVFEPMANCASQVIADNAMSDKIKLIRKRSTDMQIGPDQDMEQRANILVTEVFDTELIGEGAIPTFHHAHAHLLQDNCIVVPSAANLYAQVVHSSHVRRWNTLDPIDQDNVFIEPPPEVSRCRGAVALHDLQLDQLPQHCFTPITPPLKVFRFDYSGKSPITFHGHSAHDAVSDADGTCDAVFMWWDLEMDTKGKVLLSCAPRWGHPTPDDMAWREHWMQAIYYPATPLPVSRGQTVQLHSFHDEYSLWFNICEGSTSTQEVTQAPACTCGAHVINSRARVGMLNDAARNTIYARALARAVTAGCSISVCLSDSSLLPLMVAELGARKVYAVEPHAATARLMQRWVTHNGLDDVVKVVQKKCDQITSDDLDGHQPNLVVGEPYFSASSLPWHHVHFWYARAALASRLAPQHMVLPSSASMRAVAVDFENLWKIRAPVSPCEGFDLSHFDNIIEASSDIADAAIEPQPLWEYPGKPLAQPFNLLDFDFTKNIADLKNITRQGYLSLENPGTLNAVAVWMEFRFGPKLIVSNGLLAPVRAGHHLVWEQNAKQGVYLMKEHVKISANHTDEKKRLHYYVCFKPKTGDFEFKFYVK